MQKRNPGGANLMSQNDIIKPRAKNRTSASLMEYGFSVGSATVDSALTKSKMNR